jgi:PAS domain S-box-containing protein
VDSWHERIHPVDYKRVLADVQNHLEGLTPQFENTHRLQHKDGSYRWVLCRGKAVTDARGKPIRIVGMHIDVTDQRRGEDRTHEVQGKYYQLLETESNGVFLVDAESEKILETNKSASQIYGYNKQEFLSLKFGDLSAQSEKTRKSLKKLAKYTRQRYHKKKDGSVFPVEMTVSPFVLQGRDMLMVICKDNTEQQKIETALWESQSKYRQLFEAASNAIIVFDANTQQVFDVNSAAMDLYGYTKEEWMHLTTEDLSAEPVKSRAAFYTGNKRFQVIPLRWHKKRDGGVFPVEISTGSSYLFQGRSLVCATLRDITERKEAEEALRKEKDFINTLVQSSPTFFVAINPDGKIRMMNKAMLLALSYALEEVVDRDFLTTCVPANEHSVVKTEFDALTKSMRPSMIECHLLPRQGTPLLVEWHSRAIVQPDGSLDYLFGVGINVTERAETQANLRLFKAIIDASEEAISISDAQGNLVYINPSHIKLFGKTLEEFNADKKSYYPPESQEIVNREVVPTLARGQSWTGELDVRDSHDNIFPIWQRVEAVRDANGKILYSFKLMHDISERKRMWETLRGQWEEYQLIFNSVPLMIWHRDKENRLLRANKLALEVFGDEDEAKDFFEDNQEIMETGEPRHGIIEFTPPGAQNRRRLQTGRIPYRDKNGEIIGIIVFALDITEYQSGGSGGNSIADILRPFLENSPLMLVALDANGRIIAWNHAAENATGFTAKEITRHTKALEILFPDVKHRQRVLERLRKPGSDYRDWESMVMTKEGNLRPVSWTSLAARFPVQGWHFWLVGMDIGSKHKVDKALLEKDTLLPYIFNMVRIGIAVTDDRGRFVKVNPAYAEIYGCPIEELIGQPFTYILPPKMHDDAIREYFSILVSNEEATFARRIEQQRSGAPFEAGIISSRIILEDGRRLLMTVVTRVTAPK